MSHDYCGTYISQLTKVRKGKQGKELRKNGSVLTHGVLKLRRVFTHEQLIK